MPGYLALLNKYYVVHIGKSQAGLPIGMQIVGKRWQDLELLAIARQIARPIDNFEFPSGY